MGLHGPLFNDDPELEGTSGTVAEPEDEPTTTERAKPSLDEEIRTLRQELAATNRELKLRQQDAENYRQTAVFWANKAGAAEARQPAASAEPRKKRSGEELIALMSERGEDALEELGFVPQHKVTGLVQTEAQKIAEQIKKEQQSIRAQAMALQQEFPEVFQNPQGPEMRILMKLVTRSGGPGVVEQDPALLRFLIESAIDAAAEAQPVKQTEKRGNPAAASQPAGKPGASVGATKTAKPKTAQADHDVLFAQKYPHLVGKEAEILDEHMPNWRNK